MKSISHSTRDDTHFLVEQEAAIDDYLAGLLKDIGEPGSSAALGSHRSPTQAYRAPASISLAIVGQPAVPHRDPPATDWRQDDVEGFDEDFGPDDEWVAEEAADSTDDALDLDLPPRSNQQVAMWPHQSNTPVRRTLSMAPSAESVPVRDEDLSADPLLVSEPTISVALLDSEEAELTQMPSPSVQDAQDAPPAQEPDSLLTRADAPEIADDDAQALPEESTVEADMPSARIETTPVVEPDWRIFAVGAAKVGLPVAEIFQVVADQAIEPIKGAPAHVAGTLTYQGRRRMILSLGPWFPGKAASPSQVILLGSDGLWGVSVGAELTDQTNWDEAQTHWRDDAERRGTRPWLAGVNRTSGIAFLTVAALRAALSAPRSGS